MNFQQIGNSYILELEQHEEFAREVKKFCLEHNIKQAKISAFGTINSVTLGFYNVQSKEYIEQSFHKAFELVSAIGFLSIQNNEQILHIHATITDKDYRAYGGHLFRAVSSYKIEVIINEF